MPSLGQLSVSEAARQGTSAPAPPGAASPAPAPAAPGLPDSLPDSLLGFAHLVLATADPARKCVITREAVRRMRAGGLCSIRPAPSEIRRIRADVGLLDRPPRQQQQVTPGQVGKR